MRHGAIMERRKSVNGREYLVVRKNTSNGSASASVDGTTITIQIPSSWPREEGFKAFLRLEKRMLRKLGRNPDAFAAPIPVAFADGQEITVVGKRFLLRKTIGRGERTSSARLEGETVIVRLSPSLSPEREAEVFTNLARRVMASVVHSEVDARVRRLNETHFQGALAKVFIKDSMTNFGSCSLKGNVNLSFRLLFAPEAVLNYVIIHELAHLKERNHSPAFWALVEKAVPDYKEHRRWLRGSGRSLGRAGAGAPVHEGFAGTT
jgi:predicted metal-dependent hydrolase